MVKILQFIGLVFLFFEHYVQSKRHEEMLIEQFQKICCNKFAHLSKSSIQKCYETGNTLGTLLNKIIYLKKLLLLLSLLITHFIA